MEKSPEKKLSSSVLALKEYLFRAGTSEGIDLRRAVEMLKQCECVSKEDRGEFIHCTAIILSLL